jgi:hypothetical protein
MTQEQLNKALELSERKKRLEELNYVVSQQVTLKFSAFKFSNGQMINCSLDPNSIIEMNVNIKHEPELLDLIKKWTSVEIERLKKQIQQI